MLVLYSAKSHFRHSAKPLFYSIMQRLNKNMAHFKESEENKSSLMAQTNIVYTQGNLGTKRRRGNWQLQRSQEGPLPEPLLLPLVIMSAKGRKGKPPANSFAHDRWSQCKVSFLDVSSGRSLPDHINQQQAALVGGSSPRELQ